MKNPLKIDILSGQRQSIINPLRKQELMEIKIARMERRGTGVKIETPHPNKSFILDFHD